MIALTQTENGKNKAAAWMQGGSLAAQALGGALLLYFSKLMPVWLLVLSAALLVTCPALVALTIPEPPVQNSAKEFRKTCAVMGTEIKATLFSWKSLPGLLLLLSPVGTGAAQSLFAAMARDYRVSENAVMLLNGVLGGVLTMLGAFAAVIVPAHWDRRIAYAAAGLVAACAGLYLALAPMHPAEYYVGVAAYMLTTGCCYGFFLGVVMVTLGDAGKSASSRYTILVSLGNLPVVYMTKVEGWGYSLFGVRGVPAMDAAGNLLVALCTAAWLLLRARGAASSRTVEGGMHLDADVPSGVEVAIQPAAAE